MSNFNKASNKLLINLTTFLLKEERFSFFKKPKPDKQKILFLDGLLQP